MLLNLPPKSHVLWGQHHGDIEHPWHGSGVQDMWKAELLTTVILRILLGN